MKNFMKTKFFICGFCLLAILSASFFSLPLFSATEHIEVNADTGPKQSVCVVFENMSNELCYGTLLSKTSSTGPASVWNGKDDEKKYVPDDNKEVWQAFADYEDSDGYYFLQWFWRTDESKALNWTYYPPQEFKILLYYPERTAGGNEFCSSGVLERYAFHSYFSVDMSEISTGADGALPARLSVTKSYNYSAEVLGFFVRFFITLGVETLLAFIFGLRTKRALLTVLTANGVTQVLLNLLLNVRLHFNNIYGLFPLYFLAELCVFLAEAALYCFILGTKKNNPDADSSCAVYNKKRLILYAFTANFVSFLIGLPLAYLLPSVF